MPIQVLQREAPNNDFNAYADRMQKQQAQEQDYTYKIGMLKYYQDNAKMQSKATDSEIDKRLWDTKAEQAKLFTGLLEKAADLFTDPDQRMKYVTTMVGQAYGPKMQELLSDPEFKKMTTSMAAPAESVQQRGAGAKSIAEAKVLSNIPGMGGGLQAPEAPQTPQDMNAPRASAVGGNAPVLTGANIGGLSLGFPEGAATMAGAETRARESAKPYNLEEGKVVASRGTVGNAITELGKLVDKGATDGFMRQSAVDIGNPLLTSQMSSDTRDALNYMNHLKNLIPFARGGKQLTPFEAKLVFRLVNTQGKTRTQIKRDLNVYKREFDTMVKLISTARGDINLDDLSMTFGGGKSYEELVGNKGGTAAPSGNSDPLELFGGR